MVFLLNPGFGPPTGHTVREPYIKLTDADRTAEGAVACVEGEFLGSVAYLIVILTNAFPDHRTPFVSESLDLPWRSSMGNPSYR